MIELEFFSEYLTLSKILSSSLKFFGILGSSTYLIFAIVYIRQIKMMKDTVLIKDGGLLMLLGYMQTAIAFLLLLYSFFL